MYFYSMDKFEGKIAAENNDLLLMYHVTFPGVQASYAHSMENMLTFIHNVAKKGPIIDSKSFTKWAPFNQKFIILRKVDSLGDYSTKTEEAFVVDEILNLLKQKMQNSNKYDYILQQFYRELQSRLKPFTKKDLFYPEKCCFYGAISRTPKPTKNNEDNENNTDNSKKYEMVLSMDHIVKNNYSHRDGSIGEYELETLEKDIVTCCYMPTQCAGKCRSIKFVSTFDKVEINYPITNSESTTEYEAGRFANMVRKLVRRRKNYPSGYMDYFILPSTNLISEPSCTIRKIDPLTTDEILSFFNTHKRSGSKIDTFTNALQDMSFDMMGSYEGHEKKFAFIISKSNISTSVTSNKAIPLDFILTIATKLKILSSSTFRNGYTILAEITENKSDDFINYLYSIIEESNGLVLVGLGNDSIKNLISYV